jgi:replicative DNA helicase
VSATRESAVRKSSATETAREGHRLPPQNTEAEEAVLGALLLDREAIHQAMELLEPVHFYVPRNGDIFQAMTSLYQKSRPVDLVTLTEELNKAGKLDSSGGASYLGSLQASVATSANVAHYANIVMEKYILRRLISSAASIVDTCYSAVEDASEALDRAEAEILSISQGRDKQSFEPVKNILMGSFERLQKQAEAGGALTGVPTGFTKLDEMTGGLQPGDMIIAAGRPSMGKTALCLNIAQNAAIEHKQKVAIFSLEMSKEALVQRMLTSEARVNAHRLRSGNMKNEDWALLTEAAGHLNQAEVYIDDSAGSSVLEMRAKARRLQAQFGLDLIIVDYLQLMRASGRSDNRQQEITEISRNLKGLAKELHVPVLALSQLSRAVMQRGGDHKPMLSDLRESGSLEQDADLVMFIHRPEMFKPEDDELLGRAELIIGKQRNGPTGTIRLTFHKDYTRFENPAPDEYDYIDA